MRYIQKLPTPEFFIEDTRELRERIKREEDKSEVWKAYHSQKKRELKKYILENEQNWLCGYCEKKIKDADLKDHTHLEHVKPKSLDYDNLTFDYQNLIVSCDGTCENTRSSNTQRTCETRKGNKYDESKFLNPTLEKNIRKYFIYDGEIAVRIEASDLDKEKAEYTIEEVLGLNDGDLPTARKWSLEKFTEIVKEIAEIEGKTKKEVAKELLAKENLAFISFLKYEYRSIT